MSINKESWEIEGKELKESGAGGERDFLRMSCACGELRAECEIGGRQSKKWR